MLEKRLQLGPNRAKTGPVKAKLGELLRRLRGIASPARAGFSLAIGVFIGCLPLYGLHLPLCVAVCMPFKLDAVLAYLGANISNPLFSPALLALEVEVGSFILTGGWRPVRLPSNQQVLPILSEVATGSVVVGLILGALLGGLAFALARVSSSSGSSALTRAIRRASARYRGAPMNDRCYVATKLRVDPVLRSIARLGALGSVFDAGAGRGQLGLALLELGNVTALRGFDFDERKVAIANRAAKGDAEFTVGDLRSTEIPKADTILLVDVLHYLSVAEQDAVLARCRAALDTGGRLILREVDTKRSAASWFSRALEWVLTRIGFNRLSGNLEFRSPEELVARCRALDLECEEEDGARGTPFENRLIVARSAAPQP